MLSIPHMIVVFVIVLVVFGPQKLPELARGLGKLMAEFRKASTDFKSAFENEMRDIERQAADVERKKRELLAAAAAPLQSATLATPPGVETQPGPAQLAAPPESAGATEAPLIIPVAESVARSTEPAEANPEPPKSLDAPAPPDRALPGTQPQDAASPNALDDPHDYKQPA